MSSKLLFTLALGVFLILAALLAWPTKSTQLALRPSQPVSVRVSDTTNTTLVAPLLETDRALTVFSPESSRLPEDSSKAGGLMAPEPTRTFTVHARLLDGVGEPLASGVMHVPEFKLNSKADEHGNVTIHFATTKLWTDTRKSLYLRIEAPGFAVRQQEIELTREAEVWLGDFRLERAVRIEGQVVDENGAPVANALVVAANRVVREHPSARASARRYGQAHRYSEFEAAAERPYASRTDHNGRFVIDDFVGPWATVFAQKDSGPWAFASPIAMIEGQKCVEVRLVLEAHVHKTWIRGLLQDPNGQPLGANPVTLREVVPNGHGRKLQTKTNSKGVFEFAVEQDSHWNLHAEANAWERNDLYQTNIPAGMENLVLILENTEWFWVQVDDENGSSLTGGQVFAIDARAWEERQRLFKQARVISDLSEEGRARLRICESRFYLVAEVHGFERQTLGPFRAGRTETVAFQLASKPMIQGTLTTLGNSFASATVSLQACARNELQYVSIGWQGEGEPFSYDVSNRKTSTTQVTQEGSFQLDLPSEKERIRADSWLIRAQSPNFASVESGPYSTDELQDLGHLQLAASPGGSVGGLLKLGESTSSVGWTVLAMSSSGERAHQSIRSDAAFMFEDLRPGYWQLRAFKPGANWSQQRGSLRAKTERTDEVLVSPNRTTHANITVLLKEPLTLKGKLSLGDVELGPWRGYLSHPIYGAHYFEVDQRGQFEAQVSHPGEWNLLLNPTSNTPVRFDITDTLDLSQDVTDWEGSFELELLSLKAPPSPAEEPFEYRAIVHTGPDRLRAISVVHFEASGEYAPRLFPIGSLELMDGCAAYGREPGDPTFVTRQYRHESAAPLTIELQR